MKQVLLPIVICLSLSACSQDSELVSRFKEAAPAVEKLTEQCKQDLLAAFDIDVDMDSPSCEMLGTMLSRRFSAVDFEIGEQHLDKNTKRIFSIGRITVVVAGSCRRVDFRETRECEEIVSSITDADAKAKEARDNLGWFSRLNMWVVELFA